MIKRIYQSIVSILVFICVIMEANLLDDFNPVKLKKEMDDINQYTTLVKFDFDYLKNPRSEVVAPAVHNQPVHLTRKAEQMIKSLYN